MVDSHIATFRPSKLLKPLSKSREALFHLWIIFGEANQHTDAAHRFGLLRAHRDRPRGRRDAEQRDELAPRRAVAAGS
jgi:hypothetical protein